MNSCILIKYVQRLADQKNYTHQPLNTKIYSENANFGMAIVLNSKNEIIYIDEYTEPGYRKVRHEHNWRELLIMFQVSLPYTCWVT